MGNRPELRPHDDGPAGGRRRLRCRADAGVGEPRRTHSADRIPLSASSRSTQSGRPSATITASSLCLPSRAENGTGDECHAAQRPAQRLLRRQRRRHPLLLRMGNRPELRPHDGGAARGGRRLGSRADAGRIRTRLASIPITTYHFRLVALQRRSEPPTGSNESFTTPPDAPLVSESVTRCAFRKRDGPRPDQPRRWRYQISLRICDRGGIRSERDLRTQRAGSRRGCGRRTDIRRQ